MRCFLGCDLSPKAKINLDMWRDKALHISGEHSPVKPASFHITTWFLGDMKTYQLDALVNETQNQIDNSGIFPFSVLFDDIVVWSKPKLVAVAMSTIPKPLLALHRLSKNTCENVGIKTKGNHDVFRPHITLVRKVKPEQTSPPLFLPNITTEVTHLHLFESVSGRNGVQYIPRFSFRLPSNLSVREQLKHGIPK